MGGKWRDTTLGDVLTLQRGFDLPETERKPGPYPVIASTGPVGSHQMAMVKGPGVVIGRSGSLGGGQFMVIPNYFGPKLAQCQ
jgi:type I restriction enzyme S subunit